VPNWTGIDEWDGKGLVEMIYSTLDDWTWISSELALLRSNTVVRLIKVDLGFSRGGWGGMGG
jgi:hypothetical protein